CSRVIRADSNPSNSIGNASDDEGLDGRGMPRSRRNYHKRTNRYASSGHLSTDASSLPPVTEMKTTDEGYMGDDNEIYLLGRTTLLTCAVRSCIRPRSCGSS